MPIATLFVVFLSNLYFTLFSTLSSTQRNVIEPTANTYVKRAQPYIERAESYVPTPVKHGFTNGVHLAEGLGNTAIKVASHAAYGPLRVVEWGAQTSTR